ncbi:MAG: steroid delta-isomerase, partial [Bacteroidota bacterium]
MKTLISILVFASSYFLLAQPNTEVYLFDISYDKRGLPQSVKNPINISQNEGYDNQPAFWPDGKSILY